MKQVAGRNLLKAQTSSSETSGWLSTDYMVLYPRRQNYSQPPQWEPQTQHLIILFMYSCFVVEGTDFKSWPGYRLFWLWFLVTFLSTSRPLPFSSSLFSIHYSFIPLQSWNSSVSVVNGFGLEEWGIRIRFPAGWDIFHFSIAFRPALRPIQLSNGDGDSFSRSKAWSRYAWSCISSPSYVFMEWCFIKHGDNFTFAINSLQISAIQYAKAQ
jgi:hypothetical protein